MKPVRCSKWTVPSKNNKKIDSCVLDSHTCIIFTSRFNTISYFEIDRHISTAITWEGDEEFNTGKPVSKAGAVGGMTDFICSNIMPSLLLKTSVYRFEIVR